MTAGRIRINYGEPKGIPWTAQSDLVPGQPYTYATDGLMVTVDWLDPDPLHVEEDEYAVALDRWWMDAMKDPEPRSPSLTVPLVLLCAVLTVLVAVWWVKG